MGTVRRKPVGEIRHVAVARHRDKFCQCLVRTFKRTRRREIGHNPAGDDVIRFKRGLQTGDQNMAESVVDEARLERLLIAARRYKMVCLRGRAMRENPTGAGLLEEHVHRSASVQLRNIPVAARINGRASVRSEVFVIPEQHDIARQKPTKSRPHPSRHSSWKRDEATAVAKVLDGLRRQTLDHPGSGVAHRLERSARTCDLCRLASECSSGLASGIDYLPFANAIVYDRAFDLLPCAVGSNALLRAVGIRQHKSCYRLRSVPPRRIVEIPCRRRAHVVPSMPEHKAENMFAGRKAVQLVSRVEDAFAVVRRRRV